MQCSTNNNYCRSEKTLKNYLRGLQLQAEDSLYLVPLRFPFSRNVHPAPANLTLTTKSPSEGRKQGKGFKSLFENEEQLSSALQAFHRAAAHIYGSLTGSHGVLGIAMAVAFGDDASASALSWGVPWSQRKLTPPITWAGPGSGQSSCSSCSALKSFSKVIALC
ncbi:hypothetical protein SUGI_1095270 [Cryptomeria japonica]|nr:hypothetical protein SUGI_1095270 [Cryptomeria japonica]